MIDYSKNKTINVYYILLSISIALGLFIDHVGPTANWTSVKFLLFIISVALVYFALRLFFFPLLHKSIHLLTGSKSRPRCKPKTYIIIAFICILTSYIIVWLAYYPGLWNYDAWQVNQVINHEYTTWHPLLHTLLIGNLYKLGLSIGVPYLGVILYDWIQILSMSVLFAYICYLILTLTNNKYAYYASVIFYALFPFHALMAISSTKDILFSVFVLLFLLQMRKTINDTSPSVSDSIFLFIIGLIMLLFRNNAPHAFVLFLVPILIAFLLRKISIKNTLVLLAIFIAYILFNHALVAGLHAEKSSIAEAASIPSVQMARIYSEGVADDTDKELINRYIDWTTAHYDPHLADGLKENLKDVKTSSDLINMYIDSAKLFLKHPLVSLDSFLYLHEGAWYIGDSSHAKIYGEGLEFRQGYFPTEIKDGFGFQLNSKLPQLEHLFEVLFSGNAYRMIPILPLLLSPALYNWICLGCFCYMFSRKQKKDCLAVSFLICIILTTLLGPTVLVRYYYPIIVSCPILLAWLCSYNTSAHV